MVLSGVSLAVHVASLGLPYCFRTRRRFLPPAAVSVALRFESDLWGWGIWDLEELQFASDLSVRAQGSNL